MGELFSAVLADFKGDEWKLIKERPVILECLKDNSMIEIIDIDSPHLSQTFIKYIIHSNI